MYYVGNCLSCDQGLLGIRICCQNQTGVIVCDECDAVWFDPRCSDSPLFPEPPDSLCPRCKRPLWLGHWASMDEIETIGWDRHVAGEYDETEESTES